MEIKIEDLMEKCGGCGGTGKNPEAVSRSGGGGTFGRQVVDSGQTSASLVAGAVDMHRPQAERRS